MKEENLKLIIQALIMVLNDEFPNKWNKYSLMIRPKGKGEE